MSKQMSVKERFSLEFVTATGESAFLGACSQGDIKGALPDFILFDTAEETATPVADSSIAAFDAVEELKALFGAVQQ